MYIGFTNSPDKLSFVMKVIQFQYPQNRVQNVKEDEVPCNYSEVGEPWLSSHLCAGAEYT
jgi:hypothetical protein